MGAGGRPDRRGRPAAEKGEPDIDVGVGPPEAAGGQIEDPVPGLELVGDAAEQQVQAERGQRCRVSDVIMAGVVRVQGALAHVVNVVGV